MHRATHLAQQSFGVSYPLGHRSVRCSSICLLFDALRLRHRYVILPILLGGLVVMMSQLLAVTLLLVALLTILLCKITFPLVCHLRNNLGKMKEFLSKSVKGVLHLVGGGELLGTSLKIKPNWWSSRLHSNQIHPPHPPLHNSTTMSDLVRPKHYRREPLGWAPHWLALWVSRLLFWPSLFYNVALYYIWPSKFRACIVALLLLLAHFKAPQMPTTF